jgi:hypothetical protein
MYSKRFLTFSIPRDVGNSFLRVANISASNGFYLIFHSFCLRVCSVLSTAYIVRTVCKPCSVVQQEHYNQTCKIQNFGRFGQDLCDLKWDLAVGSFKD